MFFRKRKSTSSNYLHSVHDNLHNNARPAFKEVLSPDFSFTGVSYHLLRFVHINYEQSNGRVILRAFVNFKLINEAVIIHTVVSRPVNSITFVLKQTRSFCYLETLAGVDHVCVSRDSRKPILRVFNSLLEIRFQTFQTLISYYSRYYWLILRRIVFCCTAR